MCLFKSRQLEAWFTTFKSAILNILGVCLKTYEEQTGVRTAELSLISEIQATWKLTYSRGQSARSRCVLQIDCLQIRYMQWLSGADSNKILFHCLKITLIRPREYHGSALSSRVGARDARLSGTDRSEPQVICQHPGRACPEAPFAALGSTIAYEDLALDR